MKVICRDCKRIMTFDELRTYVGFSFCKYLISVGFFAWVFTTVKDCFSSQKRGFVNEYSIVGICNACNVMCPQCKHVSWDPVVEVISDQKECTNNIIIK